MIISRIARFPFRKDSMILDMADGLCSIYEFSFEGNNRMTSPCDSPDRISIFFPKEGPDFTIRRTTLLSWTRWTISSCPDRITALAGTRTAG